MIRPYRPASDIARLLLCDLARTHERTLAVLAPERLYAQNRQELGR